MIKAFAIHPCPGCKKGLEYCESCKERQRASWRKSACERCLDFGVTRCDFCDGAGWVTYNFIPEGLRMAVIVERTNTALKEIDAILRQDFPGPTPANSKKLGQILEHQILSMNRLAGVLENALTASKSRLSADPGTEKLAKKVIKICLHTWRRLEQRIRELLLNLAEVLRFQAARSSTGAARELMLDRAKFYTMLSRSKGFPGTSLEHPFLSEKA